jgi:hypothetical protein
MVHIYNSIYKTSWAMIYIGGAWSTVPFAPHVRSSTSSLSLAYISMTTYVSKVPVGGALKKYKSGLPKTSQP